ncbi:MAG: hypothetical protein HC836_16150 [Richelia sp. RM2_1_2]|nr:hypothetical protein [Richelia sp. RM2_1_2]
MAKQDSRDRFLKRSQYKVRSRSLRKLWLFEEFGNAKLARGKPFASYSLGKKCVSAAYRRYRAQISMLIKISY